MEAEVYTTGHDWYVAFTLAGVEVDHAGPFDDEGDAQEAASRHGQLPSDPWMGFGVASWSGGRYQSKREKQLAARAI